ncbi:hypothetical protein [Pseudomonas baltica]|uniref:hypothetical protein n=1 Tax=Pseudomonas baltica TaxID=2762576 RepID=UPI00289DDD55|nr:hypothetical protein [Pseudomonas baltica]
MDVELLKAWPFAPMLKSYSCAHSIAFAKGFGAGLPGPLCAQDQRFLQVAGLQALPAMAVALADGEFWQRDPRAGLHWQQIVHAEEAITFYAPLPVEGRVVVTRGIEALYDRGPQRGALFVEQQTLSDEQGRRLATVQVKTIALGDGGFGGTPEPLRERVSIPERAPDAEVEMLTPLAQDALFRLPAEFAVAAQGSATVLRGLCGFGLACRGALYLLCGNRPERLRHLSVRYTGALHADETVRAQVWHSGPGTALMRLWSVQRNVAILNHCQVVFDDG